MAGLLDDAGRYLNSDVWMDNRPWLMWDTGGQAAYNWTVTAPQVALDDGMYDTTQPVKAYDVTEIGYPFRTTMWEQCHGLLHQIHFTMPVSAGILSTMGQPYDPSKASQTVNMTYKEDFIRQLVQVISRAKRSLDVGLTLFGPGSISSIPSILALSCTASPFAVTDVRTDRKAVAEYINRCIPDAWIQFHDNWGIRCGLLLWLVV